MVLSEDSSEIQKNPVVQFECQIFDVCHLSSNKSKENWSIKGHVSPILHGMILMEIRLSFEKSIVQFESKFKPSTKSLGITKKVQPFSKYTQIS